MAKDTFAIAACMLRSMIDGASCDLIAREHGLTKSAVSQRIRSLANHLQQIVGVIGVDEGESPTALFIRQHGEAYLEALEHFVPHAAPLLQARQHTDNAAHITLLISKIVRHSRCVERDTALLLTLFSTGAKPLEIAQLEVRDYLDQSGSYRHYSTVRAEIALNQQSRDLPFCDPQTSAAIDTYLALRSSQTGEAFADAPYRGLQPHSRLFLTRAGNPMMVKAAGPTARHLVCKEIHEIYRRIFAYGGMPGVNTALARRLVARRLHQNGANFDEIGRALGVQKQAVHKLLQEVMFGAAASN